MGRVKLAEVDEVVRIAEYEVKAKLVSKSFVWPDCLAVCCEGVWSIEAIQVLPSDDDFVAVMLDRISEPTETLRDCGCSRLESSNPNEPLEGIRRVKQEPMVRGITVFVEKEEFVRYVGGGERAYEKAIHFVNAPLNLIGGDPEEFYVNIVSIESILW